MSREEKELRASPQVKRHDISRTSMDYTVLSDGQFILEFN